VASSGIEAPWFWVHGVVAVMSAVDERRPETWRTSRARGGYYRAVGALRGSAASRALTALDAPKDVAQDDPAQGPNVGGRNHPNSPRIDHRVTRRCELVLVDPQGPSCRLEVAGHVLDRNPEREDRRLGHHL